MEILQYLSHDLHARWVVTDVYKAGSQAGDKRSGSHTCDKQCCHGCRLPGRPALPQRRVQSAALHTNFDPFLFAPPPAQKIYGCHNILMTLTKADRVINI